MLKVEISGFYDEASPLLDEQLALCKKLGGHYICPREVDKKNIADYTYEEFVEKIKPRLDKAGILFSSIGSPIGKIPWDDDEAFNKQKKQLLELIKIAQEMKCEYIRIFAFYVEDNEKEKAYPTIVKKMKEFLALVKGQGVKLLLEDEKKVYGSAPEEILRLYQDLSDPSLALCFDASNYIQCGHDALEAFHLLKDHISYMHLKDCSKWGVEVPFGLGEGHYEEILQELSEMNYQGFFTLEPHLFWYADLKKKVYLNPLGFITEKNKYKAFRLINKAEKIKYFSFPTRKEVFVWQFTRVQQALNKEAQK
ncbi:MAG: sugar phosphate isomerase/epimerase [Bacilli bacterium]|jgi:sugar phosphate isomerase/epimerase|nr:sugar phosphate isomerase/epimerase [Bacilli bacterium]